MSLINIHTFSIALLLTSPLTLTGPAKSSAICVHGGATVSCSSLIRDICCCSNCFLSRLHLAQLLTTFLARFFPFTIHTYLRLLASVDTAPLCTSPNSPL